MNLTYLVAITLQTTKCLDVKKMVPLSVIHQAYFTSQAVLAESKAAISLVANFRQQMSCPDKTYSTMFLQSHIVMSIEVEIILIPTMIS